MKINIKQVLAILLLSFFLLLYSLKKKGKTRYSLLIISAIVFGIAFDTKAVAFMFLPLFIAAIFLRNSYSEKINKKSFQTHHFFSRSIIICLIFSGVLLVSIVSTLPFYWIGPFEQINFLKESLELHKENEYNELHLDNYQNFYSYLLADSLYCINGCVQTRAEEYKLKVVEVMDSVAVTKIISRNNPWVKIRINDYVSILPN